MSINNVAITGNLTRDPELRRTQSGTAVLRFSVAVNERTRNSQTGEWEDYANFVDCTMFGARAERLSEMLSKGAKVAVSGRLHWSSWEAEGGRRTKLEVYADELEFMSRQGRDAAGAHAAAAPEAEEAPVIEDPASAVYDDDIPF